jgi:2-methylcitrate dehydratase PrpD
MFPCCYALQRPISALREQLPLGVGAADIAAIRVRTPESTVRPLIHHRPQTGLQGKFSLEYAIAAALLDPLLGFDSFTDAAVTRPEAQRLVDLVRVTLTPSGDGLMAGTVEVTLLLRDGNSHSVSLRQPPGAPERPPLPKNMRDKLAACGPDVPELLAAADWVTAPAILARHLPSAGQVDARAT